MNSLYITSATLLFPISSNSFNNFLLDFQSPFDFLFFFFFFLLGSLLFLFQFELGWCSDYLPGFLLQAVLDRLLFFILLARLYVSIRDPLSWFWATLLILNSRLNLQQFIIYQWFWKEPKNTTLLSLIGTHSCGGRCFFLVSIWITDGKQIPDSTRLWLGHTTKLWKHFQLHPATELPLIFKIVLKF